MNKIAILIVFLILSTLGIVSASDKATVETKANVTEPVVASINVTSTVLDFESIYAGKSSYKTISITNNGNSDVTVTITPTDMVSPSGNRIPSTRLSLNSPVTITAGSTLDEQVTLDVPIDTVPDSYSGSIDIVATTY